MPYDFPEFCIENAWAFRIVFRTDVPDLLAKGAWCRSEAKSAEYVTIGNPELIEKSRRHEVKAGPCGYLSDYVRFYFTPRSMMLMNILTGWNGLTRRSASDIVILVTSVERLTQAGATFVFTDGHAHMAQTKFFTDVSKLSSVDWSILRRSDFSQSGEDPDKSRRYQAELLVHRHVDVGSLIGLACFDGNVKKSLRRSLLRLGAP